MRLVNKMLKTLYFRHIIILVLISGLFLNVPFSVVLAAPEGAQVINGQVSFQQIGNNTTITASDQAIINYNSFHITRPEIVKFVQPNSNASVLNRIISANPTMIDGMVLANGRVFFVNPAGVVIGSSARINVNQLVASGLDISNSSFLSGKYEFISGNGRVVNNGQITAESVYLIGKQVTNAGNIICPDGYVVMAAGEKVFLGEPGSNVVVEIGTLEPPDQINAQSDTRIINEGVVEASGGSIILAIAGDAFSRPIMENAGEVINSGAVDVSGDYGGTVRLEGTDRVGQFGTIIADGSTGNGGTINLRADNIVALGSDSLTTANAGINGDGGKIVAYSQGMAFFRSGAVVEAKGGSESGNGGFFEVSGKEYVETFGRIDLTATNGESGMFLIDPYNLTIVAGDGIINLEDGGVWKPTGTGSQLGIEKLEEFLGTADVTLSTFGTGGEDGDIIFNADRYLNSGIDALGDPADNSLFVRAYDDIIFNADNGINFEGDGDVELYAGVPWGDLEGSGTGSVTSVDRGHTVKTIWTRRGDIIIEASKEDDLGVGVGIDMGTLKTGAANLSDAKAVPGEIRLSTINGGDITLEHLEVLGKRYGSVYVKSSGDLEIIGGSNFGGAVQVKTNTASEGDPARSFICLIAERDVDITGDVFAEAHGDSISVAGIWIGAGTHTQEGGSAGTVTVNGVIQADSTASGATKSDATVRVYASTVVLNNKGEEAVQALAQSKITTKLEGVDTDDPAYVNPYIGLEEDNAEYILVDEYGRPVLDGDENPIPVVNPEQTRNNFALSSGDRALIVIDTDQDGTCLNCFNKITIILPIAVNDLWEQSKNLLVVVKVLTDNGDGFDYDPERGNLIDNGGTIILVSDKSTNADVSNLILVDGDTEVQYTLPPDWVDEYDPVTGKYEDSFEYYAVDADGDISENTATVTIILINKDPVAYDNSYGENHNLVLTVDEATGVIKGVVADYDPDNAANPDKVFDDELTVEPIVGGTTAKGGTVDLIADGSFTYTPSETNYNLEQDSFEYTLLDDFGGTDTATVTIDLTNKDPVAYDNSYGESHNLVLTVDEATGVIKGVVADYDPDNAANPDKVFDDTLSVTPLVGQMTANGGTVTLSSEGSFTYTPEPGNTSGEDSFTYKVNDDYGGTSNIATVTITLNNEEPVALNDSYTNSHNLVLDVTDIASGIIEGLMPNTKDYDSDNANPDKLFSDILTVEPIVAGITDQGGTVTVNSDGTFTYTPSETNYDMAPDSFEYTLLDGFGGTDTATVTINLTNQLPVAVTDTVTIAPGGSVSISVLSNDFDLDGDQINFIDYTDPSNGSLEQIGEGVFIYTPDLGFIGTDRFAYSINSAGIEDYVEGSVTITVFRETPRIPGLIPPEVQFTELQQVEGTALADLLWMAKELGLCQGDLDTVEKQTRCQEITQAYLAGAFLQTTDLHPYRAATQLRNLAGLLHDPDGYRTSALIRVVAEFVQPDVPPSPEQFDSIAQAFELHTDDGTHYATAGQWLDALAEYVAILNSNIGWPSEESVAFVMGKYGTAITEAGDISAIAFIQLYLEGISG